MRASRSDRHPLYAFLVHTLLLAGIYVLAGLIGLQVAVPPGYATIIWPPSGIALGALLLTSWRLSGGVFIGALAVNIYASLVMAQAPLSATVLIVTTVIALGSTLQALVGALLIKRLFGTPIRLASLADLVKLALVAGPLACLISALIGTATLVGAGFAQPAAWASDFFTWWAGNLLGTAVFLPIALLGPWRPGTLEWSGRAVAGLTLASTIALLVPLGLTAYSWKWTSTMAYESNRSAMSVLAAENEKALLNRLDAYVQALDGGAGLFQASWVVSAQDWQAYVEALDIGRALPGVNGLGFIDAVPQGAKETYVRDVGALGVPDFAIHPPTEPTELHYIIRYIEPIATNRAARGLNIAFEANRREAAEAARDRGLATITRRIVLVQDNQAHAGFLLLRPLYRAGEPVETIAQRRAAFLGWVYAPFVGDRFLSGLTESQGDTIDISVFDGATTDPEQLIFTSQAAAAPNLDTHYSLSKTIAVMGQTWTVAWTSTPAFEAAESNNEPLLVLAGGLLLSALFAAYLASFSRRELTIQRTVAQKTRELTAREQENAAVVNTAVVGIMLFDETGNLLSANRAALRIFRLDPHAVTRTSIRTLIVLDPSASIAQIMAAFAAGDGQASTLAQGQTGDGGTLDLEFQVNGWTTEDGRQRFTAIARDITLQRATTRALETAEQRWNSALRGSSIGVFDIDLRTGHSIVSDTWKEMLGFKATDVIEPQTEWLSRVHPDDLPIVQQADQRCFAGQAPHSASEYRIRHKDGHWIWLRSDATVTSRNAKGEALRLVGTQTDITELKAAEAALRFSEERLRTAIANAPIGMALLDKDGRWLKVNDALCAFLGYDKDEFMDLNFQAITHPADLGSDLELVKKLTSGQISTYQLEKRYVHKDGHHVWGLLSVSAARNSDGQIEYFISQILDIQHRKEMDRLQSEFISNVSHELRTPLTSIRGSLGLVTGAMATGIPENVMRLLTIAHKNSERLILLINDILDLEKISSDRMRFDIGVHDLGKEVELAVDTNQAFADQFNVRFDYRPPTTPVLCQFDTARLQQVLSNLMSNAAKFSPRDGVVTLELEVTGPSARVKVTDRGPGIPSSFRSRIFSPFSQADASATREKGGTGLGLHISRRMMERMHGVLDYVSEEGAGSTFWIDVPLVREQEAPQLQVETKPALPHILHVEDDVDFREFIAAALAGRLAVSHAGSLAEAKALLAQRHFDLLLLDLNLPDGDGLRLLDDVPFASLSGVQRPAVVLTASEFVSHDPRIGLCIVKSRTSEAVIVDKILKAAGAMTGMDPNTSSGP